MTSNCHPFKTLEVPISGTMNWLKGTQEREFFGSDFKYCTYSLLVLLKYSDFVNKTV